MNLEYIEKPQLLRCKMKYLNKTFQGLIFISILFCVSDGFAVSDEADTKKAQSLQAELEHSLVAPCCWNMTVDNHESDASHKVRKEIASMIKEGKTKDEILQAFVVQYGERILASPSKKNFLGKLAYWLIPLALVFGVFIVGKALSRLSHPTDKRPSIQLKGAEQQNKDSYWNKRVEEELKKFE